MYNIDHNHCMIIPDIDCKRIATETSIRNNQYIVLIEIMFHNNRITI